MEFPKISLVGRELHTAFVKDELTFKKSALHLWCKSAVT